MKAYYKTILSDIVWEQTNTCNYEIEYSYEEKGMGKGC
jgi:hypothetical protein